RHTTSSASSMTEVIFTSEGGGVGVIVQRKCVEGAFIKKDAVIIEYRLEGADPKSPPLKLKSPADGVVLYKPGTGRKEKLANGAPLCTLTGCPHQYVMKDMCATCGENLREKDGRPGERKTTTTASVPMNHSLPELLVSDEIARADGERHKSKCLESRKLVLLVDLDQTVIHTTNRQPSFDPKLHPDITHFSLYGGLHWTKLRPHTRAFFENLSPLYEMHIITFGQRQYAHKIAEIIDPTRHIFYDRILSRDESLSQQHKTKNLAALFPAGEEMVAIIDDRPDVWEFSDALVQLRPYKYFPDVDDINAPPGAEKEKRPDEPASSSEEKKGDGLPEETDETLLHVEKVLKKVHEAFYNHFDTTGNIRDLKVIISCLREQSLKGCVLVLSGLIPVGSDPKRSEAYRIATKFGARVEEKVDEQTTHVVAARWGTTKVYEARRLGVPIVTPHWIYACMELWEKAPEQPFLLTEKSVSPIGTSLGLNAAATGMADLPTLGKDLLSDMKNEVDSLSEDDDGESDEEDDEEDEDIEPSEESRVRAPEVARPKIDESRVKRKLCPEALDRGYTGESAGEEEDQDDDPFGGMSKRKRSKRNSRAEEEEEVEVEKRDDEEDPDAQEADYGDNDDDNEDIDDDDDDMDDMAAELEHQLEH
ncbi:hypothetical protein PMAYCL1PPCAC_23180, partial [Pristionchus mayeri]